MILIVLGRDCIGTKKPPLTRLMHIGIGIEKKKEEIERDRILFPFFSVKK